MKQHEAISALAGAGKTYQLTLRFLALLSYDARPESILAITFTRKAAGEIFDRILRRIAGALLNESERQELEGALRKIRNETDYSVKTQALSSWLKALVRAMPLLRIGTIDSFFFSVARAFAFELGIPPQCEILEAGLERITQEEALDATLAEAISNRSASTDLIKIFQDLTQGETKAHWEDLVNAIREAHALYLEHPNSQVWDGGTKIGSADLSNPSPWWKSETEDADALIKRLLTNVAPQAHNSESAPLCAKAIEAFRNGFRDLNLIAKRVLEHIDDIQSVRPFEVQYNKQRYAFSQEQVLTLKKVIARAVVETITRLQQHTRGTYHLVHRYEQIYHARIRSKGRLSFADVKHLLANAPREAKLNIDYRLDGRFDHWMIDEFQDTSLPQWNILENLADEVLQNDIGNRSFFYVGDPKQAIYGWRGGDTTLFDEILQKYQTVFSPTATVLTYSWRSSPAVLEVVNKVFSPDNLGTVLKPWPDVVARWRRHWVPHEPAPKNSQLPGLVELHTAASQNEEEQDNGIYLKTLEIVNRLTSAQVRSIAILVRLNSFGEKIAEFLRKHGLAVRREINPKLLDNGAVSALLSLFHFADFPDDLFSFHHVMFSGLGRILAETYNFSIHELESNKPAVRRALAACIRADCAMRGIAKTLNQIIALKSTRALGYDPFVEGRLRQLIVAAIEFDHYRGGGPSAFARYAAECSVKDPISTNDIHVMTIHKAKGLEFDAVILPDLQGRLRELNALRTGALAVFNGDKDQARNKDTSAGWIFPIPNEHLAKCDKMLANFRASQEEKRVYEELCLLYVAMTRARQGLFMLTKPTASQKIFPATILNHILRSRPKANRESPVVAQHGIWPTPQARPANEPPPPPVIPFSPLMSPGGGRRRRLIATSPSQEETLGTPKSAASLFDPRTRFGLDHGTLVHKCFEKIEWYTPGLEKDIATANFNLHAIFPTELIKTALQEIANALQNETVQNLLRKPSENAEVWREQAFEMSDETCWITGRIDRVVIEKDSSGQICSASVLDFKTDRVDTADTLSERVKLYRPQMQLYKEAVSRVTGLSVQRIRGYLIFTHMCHSEEC